MRLESGEIWPIPITLATDLEASAGDAVELSAPNGKRLGRLEVSEVFDRDVDTEAELVYRTTDDEHPGVAAIRREGIALPGRADRGGRPSGPRGGFHAPLPDARAVEEGVRRPRLEADRRLSDPQPDPPRPRVPDQGRARGLRRAVPASADRRDEEGRHPGGRADALLRGPDGEVLPPRAGDPRRQPGEDALRRAARSGAARDHPAQLRLHPLHRRPRPRRGRRLLRHLRRAADLRRHRLRRARHRAAVLRAHLLVPRLRGNGVGQDLSASAGVAPVPIGHQGPRDARPRGDPAARIHQGRGCRRS